MKRYIKPVTKMAGISACQVICGSDIKVGNKLPGGTYSAQGKKDNTGWEDFGGEEW